VIATPVLVALAALAVARAPDSPAASLPVCGNGTIRQVVKRTGCTLGDRRCWVSSGGYCTDWVERMVRAQEPARIVELGAVAADDVRKGDLAMFVARSHYAYVERVVTGKDGRPVAVDLSEYNFGTCWVDEDFLVTDQYRSLHRRSGVPLREVDGGFLRARPAGR
jgi:hypothetical protein